MRRPRLPRACVLLGPVALVLAAPTLLDRQAPSRPAPLVRAAAVQAAPTLDEAFEERLSMRQAVSRSRRASEDQAALLAAEEARRVWPAGGGRTGWFGERRGSHIHPGIDIDGEIGDPIVAAALGTVVHVGWAPSGYGGYGLMVLLQHPDGVQTLYAHLSRVAVAPGQHVPAGHLLGAMGVTGNVTGSHLHFEVRVGGRPIDPQRWLPAR